MTEQRESSRRSSSRSPRVAAAILARFLPRSHRADVLGDLEERYQRRCASSWLRARLWYWRESLYFLVRVPASRADESAVFRNPLAESLSVNSLLRDLRGGVRALLRQPAFSIVALTTLALGVGANAAVFSVLDGLVLRPLPYPDAQQLTRFYHFHERRPEQNEHVTGADYLDYRERVAAFEHLAAFYTYGETGFDLAASSAGRARRLRSLRVSANYFATFGVAPVAGQPFDADAELGGSQVAVVSARLQREVFGSESAVGRNLVLDGQVWQVVGVMAAGFRDVIAGDVDLWVPQNLAPGDSNNRDNQYLTVVGRLRAGTSIETAQAEIDAVAAELGVRFPDTNSRRGSRIVALHDDVLGNAGDTLWMVMGAAGFVLLIACANVANLSIARGYARRKELAVRAALGSGRGRIVRQLLAESLVLSLVGAGLGLVLAWGVTGALLQLAPEALVQINEVRFDPRVLGFVAAVAVATAIGFGVLPALRAVGGDLESALRSGDRGNTSGASQARVRATLVVAEVALSIVLLVGAGLLIRSVALIESQDLGVTDDEVLTFEVRLPSSRYPGPAERVTVFGQLREAIEQLPGVASTGAIQVLPVTGASFIWGYFVENPEAENGWDAYNANVRIVDGDYFDAAGISLLAGRTFDVRDAWEGESTVIVNRAFVDATYPDGEAIDRQVRIAGQNRRIIGVVSDTALDPRSAPYPTAHFPYSQWADRNWALVQMVRTNGPTPEVMDAIRERAAAIDPDLVAFNARPLRTVIGAGYAQTRFVMALLVAFAAIAALLAAIGTYGVLAYDVGQRRHEIGIRLALGAAAGQVRRLVVGSALVMAGVGTAIGLAAALGLARLLDALLFGIAPTDPTVFVAVAITVLLVAVAAAYVPARRAAGVDPVRVMR